MSHGFILVVDDDDAVRETMVEVLEDARYEVRAARNGREALDILRNSRLPCLILLDLMMPVMNGWDFVRETAQDPALSGLRICLVTAVAATHPLPEGPVAIVRKPLQLSALLNVVQQHC
jgi:CheY-like chemotaxis protein